MIARADGAPISHQQGLALLLLSSSLLLYQSCPVIRWLRASWPREVGSVWSLPRLVLQSALSVSTYRQGLEYVSSRMLPSCSSRPPAGGASSLVSSLRLQPLWLMPLSSYCQPLFMEVRSNYSPLSKLLCCSDQWPRTPSFSSNML
jgi:hypothetical protein